MKNHLYDNKKDLGYYPLGRLPMWSREGVQLYNTKKANRYLTWQEQRIIKAIYEKKFDKAVLIWLILLKNSYIYNLTLFNKIEKKWYIKYSKVELNLILSRCINKCRRWDLKLWLKRWYIEKPNGKLRPIGSPTIESKLIAKGINDLVYTMFEIGGWDKNQHAYRVRHGVVSSTMAILKKLEENHKIIYEFDFKSFFNTIKMSWIYKMLNFKSNILAEVVNRILKDIQYTFKKKDENYKYEEIEDEVELKKYKGGMYLDKDLPLIIRDGVPQGLPISPILSMIALEFNKIPENVIMYADDGIYFGEDMKIFNSWIETQRLRGTKLSIEKSKLVKKEFTFLGIKYDLEKKTIEYAGKKINWNDEKLEEFLRTVQGIYGKKTEEWDWKIKDGSYADIYGHYEIKMTNIEKCYCILNSIKNKSYKGYRYFLNIGFIDITGCSSFCIDKLIENKKELNLKSISSFRFNEKRGNFGSLTVNKGTYYENIKERFDLYHQGFDHRPLIFNNKIPKWNFVLESANMTTRRGITMS